MAGCVTKITLQAQRMPALNTTGIKRISVMPFEYTDSFCQSAAQYATTVAASKIQAANHFTLVSPLIINDARKKGEGIENYVDALFTGQIILITHNTKSLQRSYKDRNGNTITYVTYRREVEVDMSYSLVHAGDGILIGPVIKKGRSGSSGRDDSSGLESVNALVNSAIDSLLKLLNQDVAPYTIRINRSLADEPNQELKTQSDAALAHVKSGNYIAALQVYRAIWESSNSIAAAVNASILYEAMGETRNAADFMQQVLAATGSPTARDTLALLNKELEEQAGVEQFADDQIQGHSSKFPMRP